MANCNTWRKPWDQKQTRNHPLNLRASKRRQDHGARIVDGKPSASGAVRALEDNSVARIGEINVARGDMQGRCGSWRPNADIDIRGRAVHSTNTAQHQGVARA